MNSVEVFAAIEKIAATKGRNDKEALVEEYAQNPLFKKVLEYALDPFKTFGMKKLPKVEAYGIANFDVDSHQVWKILDKLAARELTGGSAANVVSALLGKLDEESSTLMRRIILKDMRAGFTKNTVNRVYPGLIPSFDCMLAAPYDGSRLLPAGEKAKKGKYNFPVAVEPKLDGVRVLAFVMAKENKVEFFSRSGKPYTSFDHMKEPLLAMVKARLAANPDFTKDVVFDGEVMSGEFNKTVSEVRKKDAQATDAVFHIFDVVEREIFLSPAKFGWHQQFKRRRILESFMKFAKEGDPLAILPSYLANSNDEIRALNAKFWGRGLEGAIIKDREAPYYFRRNVAWMKIKACETADVLVTGAYEGDEGKQFEGQLGGLYVEGTVDGKKVVSKCGGGFDLEQRKSFWEAWLEDKAAEGDEQKTLVGRMIEVEYHELTPEDDKGNHAFRHPRFIRFRDDKQKSEAA
jgi:DNA ligase-1